MSDYDDLLGSRTYLGQIEIYFDLDGDQTWILGYARRILKWSFKDHVLGYWPKN